MKFKKKVQWYENISKSENNNTSSNGDHNKSFKNKKEWSQQYGKSNDNDHNNSNNKDLHKEQHSKDLT